MGWRIKVGGFKSNTPVDGATVTVTKKRNL